MGFYRMRGKRWLDIVVAGGALLFLLPLLALIALAVRLDLGTPVLFRQKRPGRNGDPFVMFKFRTMRDAVDADGKPLPDTDRTSVLGRRLRASSLDELPELWNVVRGDMSLVGPRPLLMSYLDRYSPEQRRRHEVRPGMTGLAQVRGRNAIEWEAKFAFDVAYVDGVSLLLDLSVLLQTVATVVRRDGITPDGKSAMPDFLGSGNPGAEKG